MGLTTASLRIQLLLLTFTDQHVGWTHSSELMSWYINRRQSGLALVHLKQPTAKHTQLEMTVDFTIQNCFHSQHTKVLCHPCIHLDNRRSMIYDRSCSLISSQPESAVEICICPVKSAYTLLTSTNPVVYEHTLLTVSFNRNVSQLHAIVKWIHG